MLYWKTCETFKIPKTTVLNKVNGNVIDSVDGIKAGQAPALPVEVEQKKVDSSLKEAAEMGVGISKQGLKTFKVDRIVCFRNNIPSDDWWRGFCSLHPEISLRKPEPLSTMRSRMMKGWWFQLLLGITEADFRPQSYTWPHLEYGQNRETVWASADHSCWQERD